MASTSTRLNPCLAVLFKDAGELIRDLESGKYNQQALDEYRRKYLPEELGTSTRKLAELIIRNLA